MAVFEQTPERLVRESILADTVDAETAIALGLTDRTVRRDWIKARAWLSRELGRHAAVSLT